METEVYANDSDSMTMACTWYNRAPGRVQGAPRFPLCRKDTGRGRAEGEKQRTVNSKTCLGVLERAEDAKLKEKRRPNVGIDHMDSTANYLPQSLLAHSASLLAPLKCNLSRSVHDLVSFRSPELRRQQNSYH